MAPKTSSKPAAAKKASDAVVRPIKVTLTKSALVGLIAESNEISRKQAAGVLSTIEGVFLGSVHPKGSGEFTLPGLLKVTLRKVPAPAKPASVRVKIRALSKLKKTAVGA